MSQENVDLVREALNAWSEVDEGTVGLGRLSEFIAPDVAFELGDLLEVAGSDKGEIRGIDEFIEWRAGWTEPYDEWSYNAERILDAGANRVVATFHQRGKLRDSDSWVEMRYGIVYTVQEGLITRGKVYATPENALEAAGLSK
jgi:ketosteroid isomerase-like protein